MNRLLLIFPVWLLIACAITSSEENVLTSKAKKETAGIVKIDESLKSVDVSLVGNKEIITGDDRLIITAIVRSEEAEVFYWFMDGVEIINNDSKLKMDGETISLGFHRADVVAGIGERFGSDSFYFWRE